MFLSATGGRVVRSCSRGWRASEPHLHTATHEMDVITAQRLHGTLAPPGIGGASRRPRGRGGSRMLHAWPSRCSCRPTCEPASVVRSVAIPPPAPDLAGTASSFQRDRAWGFELLACLGEGGGGKSWLGRYLGRGFHKTLLLAVGSRMFIADRVMFCKTKACFHFYWSVCVLLCLLRTGDQREVQRG